MARREISDIVPRDQFPSNTIEDRKRRAEEQKKERPKVEKCIEGTAHKRKPSLGRKFRDTFFMEETPEIGRWIFEDAIVPALKDGLFTVVVGSLSMALFGTVKNVGQNRVGTGIHGDFRYDRISSQPTRAERAAKARYSFEPLTYDSKFEAEDVLERMRDMIDEYGQCSVADMYEASGVTPESIDCRWGWTALRNASVIYSRDGYMIDLPRTKPVEV